MGCCEEGLGASEGAQAELPPVFETIEHAFDDVAGLIERGIVFELDLAVLSRRDAGRRAGLSQPVAQVVGIVTAIGDDRRAPGDIRCKALMRLSNIGPVSCRQAQMDGETPAIADQTQLAVQPAFGFANGSPVAGVFSRHWPRCGGF